MITTGVLRFAVFIYLGGEGRGTSWKMSRTIAKSGITFYSVKKIDKTNPTSTRIEPAASNSYQLNTRVVTVVIAAGT
jgi:hypothetical protein